MNELAQALARALDLAPAGVEVELSALRVRRQALRLAVGAVSEAGDGESLRVRVRVAVGTQLGSVVVGDDSPAALSAAIAEAEARARRASPRARFGGFARAVVDGAGRAGADDAALFAAARAALDGAREAGLTIAGALSCTRTVRAVVTTAGARAAATTLAWDAALHGSRESTSARAEQVSETPPEIAPLVASLHAQLALGTAREAITPGAYDVVLGPAAVAELMDWLAMLGLHARAVLDGASFLPRLDGAAAWLSLDDDAAAFGALAAPFDAEGSPTAHLPLIARGRALACTHDLATAAEAAAQEAPMFGQRASTGHAAPIDDEVADHQPLPRHLVLHAGALDDAALVAGVDEGVYVPRLHYVNGLLDPMRAVMTGLTRHGARRIVGGALGPPIRDLRFTDAMIEAFARVDGVGRQVATLRGLGLARCPSLRLRRLCFSDVAG